MKNIFGLSKFVRGTAVVALALAIAGAPLGLQIQQASGATTACTATVLSKGAKNVCVTYMQQLLNSSGKAGTAMLVADGAFGPGTDAAVRTFQTNNALTADGFVGAMSWTALCSAPYTGRVTPATTVSSIKQSAGCASSTYLIAPTVQITSPASGQNVGGAVVLTANATDNDGIAKVDFYVDGSLVGSATKAPYAFYLNTTKLTTGVHSIAAVATDGIGTTNTATGSLNTGLFTDDSTNVPCAPGTDDLGVQNGYNNGAIVKIHVCGIPTLPSSSDESNTLTKYYIPGANGHAIVNARVSQQVLTMVANAKTAGITLRATSAYRVMTHQQDLCNTDAKCVKGDYSLVAQPGYSSHQLGIAIDFEGMSTRGTDMNTCSARAVEPTSGVWSWLYKNGDTYNLKQYTYESWHWDASGQSNRCGYGEGYQTT